MANHKRTLRLLFIAGFKEQASNGSSKMKAKEQTSNGHKTKQLQLAYLFDNICNLELKEFTSSTSTLYHTNYIKQNTTKNIVQKTTCLHDNISIPAYCPQTPTHGKKPKSLLRAQALWSCQVLYLYYQLTQQPHRTPGEEKGRNQ